MDEQKAFSVESIAKWLGFIFLEFAVVAFIGPYTATALAVLLLFFAYRKTDLVASILAKIRLPRRVALVILAICAVAAFVAERRHWILPEPRPNGQKKVENPIVQWGALPNNSVYASIDTASLAEFSERYRLILICVAADATREARDDTFIEKSPAFDITGARRHIQLTLSKEMAGKLMPRGTLQFYAILLPRDTAPSTVATINAAIRGGAVLVGVRGLLISGTQIEEPQKQRALQNPSIHIEQSSSGPNSPNIVAGQVTVTIEQPARRIPTETRAEMVAELSKQPGKIKISAVANNEEAYRLAQDFFEVLKGAGWEIQDNSIEVFMAGGPPLVGVIVKVHGEPVGPGVEITIPATEPVIALIPWLKRLNLSVSGQRYPDIPEGATYLEIGLRPSIRPQR